MRGLLVLIAAFAAAAMLALTPVVAQQLPGCFLSMGDWGFPDPNVASMSAYMQKVILNPNLFGCSNISLTLALGDNFYNTGVESVTDPQWQTTFVDQFRTFPAFKKMPIYGTMGDHDYAQLNPQQQPNFTRAQAQIDYYYQKDPLWVMPDANYTWTQDFGDGIRIKFVSMNTEALYACIHLKPAWCFQKNHEKWIEAELAAADNDTSITGVVLMGHHAVVCPLGGHYDPDLDAILVPIARRHRLSLILTGHSHFVAWSAESDLSGGAFESGDLWYIINGAGRGAGAYQCWWNGLVMPVAKPKNKLCFPFEMNNQGAFMLHRVHSSGLEHCVIDSMNGTMVRCQMTAFRSKN